jgi:hypothetical protein
MARFKLTQAVVLPSQFRFHAGQVVTDQPPPPTVAGDLYWAGLTAATMAPGMMPLDGSATTMKNASRYANEPAATAIYGVDSIDT